MFLPDLVIRSRRLVLNADRPGPAAVHIRNGKIIGVLGYDNVPPGCPLDDAGDLVVMPGLVDTHVHVNDATDVTDVKGGFEAVTRAAASGGVTTIVAATLGASAATTALALEETRRAAERKCYVDIGFWASLVSGNVRELPALAREGAIGFTCSLASPGTDRFQDVSEGDLRLALPMIARLGLPVLAHAEPPGRAWLRRVLTLAGFARANRRYATYLASAPKEAENQAVALLIQLCREYRAPTHVVHLSSSDPLAPIFHARAQSLPITAETCPHYLYFTAEEIPDGATQFKCAPPIRERENREFLWAALRGGLIQMVVSGHSPPPPPPPSPPSPPSLSGVNDSTAWDFLRAPGGIPSLQLSLSATWTVASARQGSIGQLTNWMCRAPARLAGLDRKGAIDVGYDADFVIWDPDAEFIVDPADRAAFEHGQPVTPYAGRRLRGIVRRSYLAGARIYERGAPIPPARGRLLSRNAPTL